MKAKDLLSPAILLPIGFCFIVISFLVWLSKGNNSKLIRTKLKLGAIILSFSWFITGCETYVTCYEPMPNTDNLYIENDNDSLLYIPGDTLKGYISNRSFNYYSFNLKNSDSISKQSGMLIADDGLFDNKNESFYMILDSLLTKGIYQLDFYGEQNDDPSGELLLSQYRIYIK